MSKIVEKKCGPLKNNYKKEDLVKLSVKKNLLTEEEALKKSTRDLCSLLNIQYEDITSDNCYLFNKEDIVNNLSDKLQSLNVSPEDSKKLNKDALCDLIFDPLTNFVAPTDFDEKSCRLYDLTQIKKIARKLGVAYTSSASKEQICKDIEVEYWEKKKGYVQNSQISSKWNDNDLKCLQSYSGNVKLEEHQIRVILHMLVNRGLMAVHSVGSGKTLTAIGTINCVLTKYPNLKVIIITPLSLKQNFYNELDKFGVDYNNIKTRSKIKIFAYEEFINYNERNKNKNYEDTFFIIDEAHNLRNLGGRTIDITNVAVKAFKILLLTATPVVNSMTDLKIPYYLLTKEVLPISKSEDNEGNEKEVILFDVKKYMKCLVSFYKTPDSDLYPRKIDMPHIEVGMDDDYFKRYKDIESEELGNWGIIGISGRPSKMFYSSLRRAVNGLDGERSPKVSLIVDFILKEAKEGRKSIVYSNWQTAGMNLLRTRLDKLGQKNLYGYISGEITPSQREMFKEKINKDITKILLISKAGSEGLNLKGIRNVIIMESTWNPATDEQIIGRAIRRGSHLHLPKEDQNVRVYRYIMKRPDGQKSVDEILYDISYVKKLPLIKNAMKALEQVSIEKMSCKTLNPKDIPVLNIPKPVILKDEDEKEPVKKPFVYVAPEGKTSLALDLKEINISAFKKLTGIIGNTVKTQTVKAVPEDEDEEIEELEIETSPSSEEENEEEEEIAEMTVSDDEI